VGGAGEVGPDVRADLGDDRRGGQLPDAGDGGQQVLLGSVRLHHRLDLGVQPGDHLLQVGDVVQVQAAHQGVMAAETPFLLPFNLSVLSFWWRRVAGCLVWGCVCRLAGVVPCWCFSSLWGGRGRAWRVSPCWRGCRRSGGPCRGRRHRAPARGPDAAEGLYRLVDAAYEKRSVAVSSNLHPAGFDELMPKTLATATVDRLMHHAHVCQTSGDSIRLTQALAGKGVSPLN